MSGQEEPEGVTVHTVFHLEVLKDKTRAHEYAVTFLKLSMYSELAVTLKHETRTSMKRALSL